MKVFSTLVLSSALLAGASARGVRPSERRQLPAFAGEEEHTYVAFAGEEYHSNLFMAVNQLRQNHSLPNLCRSPLLMSSANATVSLIAFAGELDRSINGTTSDARTKATGFSGLTTELFAADGFVGNQSGAAHSVLKQWKATPEAKKALLSPNFTVAGGAKALTPDGTHFYVAHLGHDDSKATCNANGTAI